MNVSAYETFSPPSCIYIYIYRVMEIFRWLYFHLINRRHPYRPEIEKILRKNQNGFRRNRSTTSQILTIRRIFEGFRTKNLEATLLFADFS